jgi:hypothetical protein
VANDKKPPPGPAIGTVNVLEATLGQRGKGKSTHQCARAFELVQEYGGAYVLGHSLGARLPRKLPAELGGHDLPIEYHFNVTELDKALRKRPNNWHVIAPPPLGDPKRGKVSVSSADDMIAYSMRLSQSLRDRAYDRAKLRGDRPLLEPKIRNYDGLHSPPVIVIVDEGIAVKSANTGKGAKDKLGQDWFFEWLISLRHLHTALLYAIQNPSARSWYILSEATEIDAFYIRHQWALNAVQAAGATSDQIREIRSLPPHEYVIIDDVSATPDDIEHAAKKAKDINDDAGTEADE